MKGCAMETYLQLKIVGIEIRRLALQHTSYDFVKNSE